MIPLVTRIPRAIREDERAEWARRIASRPDTWTANFGGVQHTLGRAYYTHLEEDREDEYFADASASDARVEAIAPGLQAKMFALAESIVGSAVEQREDWCGPGVHIFRAGSLVAQRGGDVHFDTEGLTDDLLAARVPALTLVLMLQPPQTGGGLAIWDRTFAGEDFPERPGPDVRMKIVDYAPRELVVIDSYRLHQIQPFAGGIDRISATVHLAREHGTWRAWF